MQTPDLLDMQIRSMIYELIESAPPAPSLPELDLAEAGRRAETASRTRRRRGRRPLVVLGAGVGALTLGLVLVAALPGTNRHMPTAAAAQLHEIALHTANQPTPILGSNQWLYTERKVSALAVVSYVGSAPTPKTQAVLNATIQEWSNAFGQSCESSTFMPAQFASPALRAAWSAAGLLTAPSNQPDTGCSTASGVTASRGEGYGSGVIDVSGLSADPSDLTEGLEKGTTGVAGIDDLPVGTGTTAAFIRAADILVGPTVDASATQNAAVYDALATLPGITNLGEMTTHSGTQGIGISAMTYLGRSTIIIDPSTGLLLEARNFPDFSTLQALGEAYEAPSSPFGQKGGTAGAKFIWQDPVGSPSVVGPNALTETAGTPVVPMATVSATVKPGVTYQQVTTLKNELAQRDGPFVSFTYGTPAKPAGAGATSTPSTSTTGLDNGVEVTWTFANHGTEENNYVVALRGSALFSSVSAT